MFQFINDWLFITESRNRTSEVPHLFVELCVRLELLVNLDKSPFCVASFDSSWHLVGLPSTTVCPPTDKLEEVVRLATRMRLTSFSQIACRINTGQAGVVRKARAFLSSLLDSCTGSSKRRYESVGAASWVYVRRRERWTINWWSVQVLLSSSSYLSHPNRCFGQGLGRHATTGH